MQSRVKPPSGEGLAVQSGRPSHEAFWARPQAIVDRPNDGSVTVFVGFGNEHVPGTNVAAVTRTPE